MHIYKVSLLGIIIIYDEDKNLHEMSWKIKSFYKK